MFTVKFYKGHQSKIVEAECINIFPAGVGEPNEPKGSRSNKVREVQIVVPAAAKADVYYVGYSDAAIEGYPDIPVPTLYDVAFIENAHGATTETVRAY